MDEIFLASFVNEIEKKAGMGSYYGMLLRPRTFFNIRASKIGKALIRAGKSKEETREVIKKTLVPQYKKYLAKHYGAHALGATGLGLGAYGLKGKSRRASK